MEGWVAFLLSSTAFFILLPAAARARGRLRAHLGFTADHGSNAGGFAVREVPGTVLLSKLAQFMMSLGAFISLKRGLEFDRAGLSSSNPALVRFTNLYVPSTWPFPPHVRFAPLRSMSFLVLGSCVFSIKSMCT